jgi:hypothetical protein
MLTLGMFVTILGMTLRGKTITASAWLLRFKACALFGPTHYSIGGRHYGGFFSRTVPVVCMKKQKKPHITFVWYNLIRL